MLDDLGLNSGAAYLHEGLHETHRYLYPVHGVAGIEALSSIKRTVIYWVSRPR